MLNWVPEKRALCPAALMRQLLAISSQESHWRGCSDSRLPLLESWGACAAWEVEMGRLAELDKMLIKASAGQPCVFGYQDCDA